jgi:Cd2+/Zn2+-exporting ATPase
VEGLVRLIEDSQAARSPTELVVERFAKLYTPCVVLVATGFATVPWVLHALDQDAVGADTAEGWLYTSLVLLVTACPCALVISTPITYVCALVRPLPPPAALRRPHSIALPTQPPRSPLVRGDMRLR